MKPWKWCRICRSGSGGSGLGRNFASALLVLAATQALPAASAGQEPDNGADGRVENAFMADRNGDGVLTEDEVRPGAFSLLDVNRDGRAEPEEVRAFLARGRGPFSWVNPPGEDRRVPGVTHATFTSPSMGVQVGYNIYLPPGYDAAANRHARRIMFRHPHLFISAAPGGPGYAVEKLVLENDGVERDSRASGANARSFDFGKGNDAYSLARSYAEGGMQPTLDIMIWVGTRGFNYEATLEYLGYLYGLRVPAERLIAPGVDHNPVWFYEAHGVDLLRFHDSHWRESGPDGR